MSDWNKVLFAPKESTIDSLLRIRIIWQQPGNRYRQSQCPAPGWIRLLHLFSERLSIMPEQSQYTSDMGVSWSSKVCVNSNKNLLSHISRQTYHLGSMGLLDTHPDLESKFLTFSWSLPRQYERLREDDFIRMESIKCSSHVRSHPLRWRTYRTNPNQPQWR